ncbi:two-component sensor histidine kinase [Winogradskyella echinorum]|uniref:histidine kinase n=1 Tax=Winogradskyella echinorum TaxID=538189 RepID=A0ABR6XYA0_9FLAO|nr:ATP-binding protein [Winogradskyella echinorum]MBC3845404.1 two-component sensor histidine kinase [Winogradskyella echinorum]MBC5749752.1 two-component sensor histidine kinase [Winogradskyella echinorum]
MLSEYKKIKEYRELSEDGSVSLEERLVFAKKAVELSLKTGKDSTILLSNRKLSFIYLLKDDYGPFRKLNHTNLKLAIKLNDSIALAYSYNNLGFYHHQDFKIDSAFYYYSKALKLFDKLKMGEDEYGVLTNIANIQQREKDYVGCEESAIKAIKIINTFPINESRLDYLWILNNLIGVVSLKLKSFDRAIEYHNKALNNAKEMDNGYYNELYSKNNLAEVYKNKGDIDKSIELYQYVIKQREQYFKDDPSFYAITLANLAYSKSLRKDKDLSKIRLQFYEAKNISDTLQDELAKIGVAIDLSRFYSSLKEGDSAIFYAEKSRRISENINNNELLLESFLILSNLKKGEEANVYLKKYIKLSDSLLNNERNARNRFARLELETDELEAENKQISKENLYLLILSIGLLLTAILIYILISQRAKNRKLKLIQVQQKANEDIYNLMLGQQDKVDEARAKEKIRVSKELHDGVLGRLFGTRLSLDSINFKDGKEAMMTRANYIGQLKTIEEDIRKISHELNTDFVSGSGFMDIVTELIENQVQAYGLEHEFNYTDDISWDLVTNKTKINIYRIIQESMQNIYKHANANAIKISISLEKDVICLDIIDDGDGFDTSKNRKGIGLKNMTSRVEDINGSISFTSQSGNGTEVNVKIPYTN